MTNQHYFQLTSQAIKSIPRFIIYKVYLDIVADYFMFYSDIDGEAHETSLSTRTSDTTIDEISYTLLSVNILY